MYRTRLGLGALLCAFILVSGCEEVIGDPSCDDVGVCPHDGGNQPVGCPIGTVDACGFTAAESTDFRLDTTAIDFPPLGPNCSTGLTCIAQDLINAAICVDADEPADMELDLTLVMLLGGGDVDGGVDGGDTTGAIGPAVCGVPDPATDELECDYVTTGDDMVVDGDLTTSDTDPCTATIGMTERSVTAGSAGCFALDVGEFTLNLGTVSIPLFDVQVIGQYNAAGDEITEGVLVGAITKADADNTLIPADVPAVGGQPLGDLLCEDDAQMIDSGDGDEATYVFELSYTGIGMNATDATPL